MDVTHRVKHNKNITMNNWV